MPDMIAIVHKGAEKIPVQVTGLDDPRLQTLCDTHGHDAVHVDGVSMAQRATAPAPKPARKAVAKAVKQAVKKAVKKARK